MNFSLILTILIVLVVIVILFKILKSILKTAVVVVVLFLIISLVFGGFVLIDANTFSDKVINQKSNYILVEGDEIITSLYTSWKNFSNFEDSNIETMTEAENSEQTTFLINKTAFSQEVEINNQTRMWEDVFSEIKSSNDSEIKNKLFADSFISSASDEGPLFLFKKMKDKTITVVEENAFVKFIKLVPTFMLSKFSKN